MNFDKEKNEGPALPDIKKQYKTGERKNETLLKQQLKGLKQSEQSSETDPCTLRTQYTTKDGSMDGFFFRMQ